MLAALSAHQVSWPEALLCIAVIWLILVWQDKAPDVFTIKYFLSALNDRGGHLAILLVLVIYFFNRSLDLFYRIMSLRIEGKIDAQDAVVLMALTFCTGSAFGGAASVFYKTMEAPSSRIEPPRAQSSADPAPKPTPAPAPESTGV